MNHKGRKRVVTHRTVIKVAPAKSGHIQKYQHHYLTVATILLSISAVTFGLEILGLGTFTGVLGTILIAVVTW